MRAAYSQSSLAGLHAGVLGGLVLVTWLAAASAMQSRPWWSVFNVFATAFLSESALQRGFGYASLTGVAVHIVISGTAGALFGLMVRDTSHSLRTRILALLMGPALFFLLHGYVWRRVSPLVTLYTSERTMFFGYVIYGIVLGRQPRYLRALYVRVPDPGSDLTPAAPAPSVIGTDGPPAA
jgi:hypothetical protein